MKPMVKLVEVSLSLLLATILIKAKGQVVWDSSLMDGDDGVIDEGKGPTGFQGERG